MDIVKDVIRKLSILKISMLDKLMMEILYIVLNVKNKYRGGREGGRQGVRKAWSEGRRAADILECLCNWTQTLGPSGFRKFNTDYLNT